MSEWVETGAYIAAFLAFVVGVVALDGWRERRDTPEERRRREERRRWEEHERWRHS